jgi:hypothetical protein
MGYVADFVTGRSIAEKEAAVAVVIVPRTNGWPDPVKAAALDPVHAHERFTPISLPLKGKINDRGYFEPSKGQLSLDLLLRSTRFETWNQLFEGAYAGYEKGGVTLGGESKLFGVSVMRVETYRHAIELGRRGQKRKDSPRDAACILIDAQRRAFDNREDQAWNVATLSNEPRDGIWTTLDGEEITVPYCSAGLAAGYPWELDRAVRRFIQQEFKNAYRKPIEATVPLFAALSDFQNLSRGLSDLGKYFTPGGFMRHDNTTAVTGMAMTTLAAALENASSRDYTGVESREDRFLAEMETVAKQLETLQNIVAGEIKAARQYLGMDNPPPMSPTPAPRPR